MLADTLIAWWWIVFGTGLALGLTAGWHIRAWFAPALDRKDASND